MANFSVNMTASRRRPKRQRTPTTIYTDDNPTTFTTKKKKGQNGQHDDESGSSRRSSTGSNLHYDETMPPPAPVVKRGRGRPPNQRKSVEKVLSGEKRRSSAGRFVSTKAAAVPDASVSSSRSSSTVKESPVEAETAPIVKRKRGRPPKNRPKEIPSPVVKSEKTKAESVSKAENGTNGVGVNGSAKKEKEPAVYHMNNERSTRRRSLLEPEYDPFQEVTSKSRRSLDSLLSSKKDLKCSEVNKLSGKVGSTRISKAKRRKSTGSSKSRARADSTVSWTRDIEGTFINHAVTGAPILPPVIISDNDDETMDANKSKNENGEKPLHEDGTSPMVPDESNAITRELQSKYPVVFDKGVPKASSCIARPFATVSQASSGTTSASSSRDKSNQSQHQLSQLPTWSPLYKPPVFFEDDYDLETGNLDIENTIPVTRHITAMTVRKPDHDYLVLGDSVGFVTIYSLAKDNLTLPVAHLESTACQTRAKPEQDILRADLMKRKKQAKGKGGSGANKTSTFQFSNSSRPRTQSQIHNPFASGPESGRQIVIDTSETMIHAVGMIKKRVVLATSKELECIDVPSGTSLWVCPLVPNRFVTSLDMHLNTFDVLVSCSKTMDASDGIAAPVSSLMLLQHSEDNVEICDANSPMLVRSPSCTAIWDSGASNRLLFITLSADRQEHDLVLVSGGSIDSWKVACKTKIPNKGSSSASAAIKLSQSPGGMYTLVASSRGIRLYQTESLQLIHVYGDQFTLHGQSVLWKDCWLAGSFFSEKNKNVTKAAKGLPSQWLQCDDWVGETIDTATNKKGANKETSDDKTPNLAPYIIGLPHSKGPKELYKNLHVWKVEHPSVVPMMSVPLPNNAEGALGLVGSGSKSRANNSAAIEDRIVLVTDDGQGHLLLPKMESNFAGISYPPGYQVVTDNLEYIEDEEATDQVNVDDEDGENDSDDESKDVDIMGEDESMDEELREAMRQSLLEAKKNGNPLQPYDAHVDILGTDGEEEKEFLPCCPEPYLRQMVNAAVEEEITETETKQAEGAKESSVVESNQNGIDETENSESTATKPKLTDAMFISNLLEIMPNKPKIKKLDEDCLSFTTTKVVMTVNPVARGRGRKSRAANLETILKASINPYLQSMMLSRQGVPVNGNGSKLRPPNPPSIRNRAKSHSGTFSEPTDTTLLSGTEMGNGDSCDSSVAGLHVKNSSSPRHVTNDDEAAVVMGLLGLSPKHTPSALSSTFVSSDSSERGSAVDGSENMTDAAVADKSKLVVIDKTCSACRGRLVIHTCGKRSLPIDYESIARAERERKEKEEEEKKRVRAEKRRLAEKKKREAKKQKERELEEQRLREAKQRLEAEQQRRLQEDLAAQDIRNRREQIVPSYANHVYQSQTSPQQAASPLDALRALAMLAGNEETLPETQSQSQGFGTLSSNGLVHSASGNGTYSSHMEPTVNQYNVPSFGASHGFSVQSNMNETVSSGIPSYASIQGNGRPNDGASPMAPTSSLYGGYSHSWNQYSNGRG